MTRLDLKQDLNALNKEIAAANRDRFEFHRLYVINIMGSPGSGKTTLLEHLLPRLSADFRTAVIEGDLATENDALRIKRTGVTALQINTGGGCHLDAKMISLQLQRLELDSLDLLIIENVGNLVCPASFDLGEDMRMVILSVTEGEDKPVKYPTAFLNAHTAVITKTDLLPYTDVNVDAVKGYIAEINPRVAVFEAALAKGSYEAGPLVDHIREQVRQKQNR